jgi:hypothetical protein
LAVDLPVTGAPIGIVTLKNRKPSPVAQLFIECAREVARSLAEKNSGWPVAFGNFRQAL